MKHIFIISLLIVALFTNCQESEENATTPIETFFYYKNYQIVDQQVDVQPGNNLILHYYYKDPGELLASDAGVIQNILVEIPNSISKEVVFNLTNSNIPDLQLSYSQSCFCAPVAFTTIKNINLEGRNIGNEVFLYGTIELEMNFRNGPNSEEFTQYSETFEFNGSIFREATPTF